MSFMRNSKSIKTQIITTVLLLVGISLLLLGGASIWLNISSTSSTLETTMTKTADVAAERIANELNVYKTVARETGYISRLSDPNVTPAEKQSIIDQRVATYHLVRGNVIGTDGISVLTGVDYNDRDYFKQALNGEVVISNPLYSKTSNELSIIIAAPLWRDGIPNSTVAGVVFYVPQEDFLTNIVKSINVSENSNSYIINKDDETIAHIDQELVINASKTIEEAKADPALNALAALETKMVNQESGFGLYSYGGVRKFLAYAPIPDTDGWSIGVNAPVNDFMGDTYTGIVITVIILAAAILISVLVTLSLSGRIARPLRSVTDRFSKLALEGDLTTATVEVETKDEIGELSRAGKMLLTNLQAMIQDIDYLLKEMSNGNFDISSQASDQYIGDFAGILDSIKGINYKLSGTLQDINEVASQVSSGSDQVAAGAQELSQGATQQASSVQELAATTADVASQIKRNTENLQKTMELSNSVARSAVDSNDSMKEMVSAMEDISKNSSEISKIIKSIEDIAFQTNILALNAAVEAARAGAAGKGFAVVADEVRSLANKSADASSDSANLIENSLQSVERGKRIADATATNMEKVTEEINHVTRTIDEITNASLEQEGQISQITIGMDQISSVVQTNSATAEESAAASEELSGQAQMLKNLVDQFRLRKDGRE